MLTGQRKTALGCKIIAYISFYIFVFNQNANNDGSYIMNENSLIYVL